MNRQCPYRSGCGRSCFIHRHSWCGVSTASEQGACHRVARVRRRGTCCACLDVSRRRGRQRAPFAQVVGHPWPYRVGLPVCQRDRPSWTQPRASPGHQPAHRRGLLLPGPVGRNSVLSSSATADRSVGKCGSHLHCALRRYHSADFLQRERRRNAAAFWIGGSFGAGAACLWSAPGTVLRTIEERGDAELGALQRRAMRCAVCFYWLIDLKGAQGWTAFLRPAAANPLLIYMLPNIVYALMKSLHVALPEPLTEVCPACFGPWPMPSSCSRWRIECG